MPRFYRCLKCGYQFVASATRARDNLKCGAVSEYLVADDPDAGNDGLIKSAGLKPLGCGGKIEEVTQEEAMNYVN